MSQLDAQGEAREALGTAVASYGQRVLSDPHALGNLVADLLPDLPRERNLLVTGAEAGIAAEMREHVEGQHIDPDTAVQLAASALSERRAIDPAAGLWVASEYAQALGYRVRSYTSAVPPVPPQRLRPAPSATSAMLRGQSWPPPQQPWAPNGPSWPPPQPSSGGPGNSWSGRKRALIAGVTAVALIGGYLIAATFAHTFPFTKSRPATASAAVHSPRPAPKPTHPATPAPTGPRLAAGVAPLVQLLPGGIDDPATQCQNDPPPYSFDMQGRVAALVCTDPSLPRDSQVYAYQLDSQAHFEATWQSFNKVIGFTGANPGPNCPPATGGEGTVPMHAPWFPPRSGQVLECLTVHDGNGPPQPVYIWTLPTEDAFLVAVGPPNSSFAALETWFTTRSMPQTSPSPSAS
jgi:hypothetical protein